MAGRGQNKLTICAVCACNHINIYIGLYAGKMNMSNQDTMKSGSWKRRQSLLGEYDPDWELPKADNSNGKFYIEAKLNGERHSLEPYELSQEEFVLAYPYQMGQTVNVFAIWAGSAQKSHQYEYEYKNRWYAICNKSPIIKEHYLLVKQAMVEGKTVQPEVLKDYPDLYQKSLKMSR